MATLTRTFARASLKRWLGNRTDLADPADYDAFLDNALFDLCTRKFHIQSLEVVGSPIVATPNVANYNLPSTCFALLHLEDTTNHRMLDRFPGGFGDFLRARQNQVSADGSPPVEFIEYGGQMWVGPQPPATAIVWLPYFYARPTWTSDATAVPGIEEEWHYGVLLRARAIAAQEAGDAARLQLAEAEWQAWIAQRDSSRKMQRRQNIPAGGVRPHPSMSGTRFGL